MNPQELTREFRRLIQPPLEKAYAVAAIEVLFSLLKASKATTEMELREQLKAAKDILTREVSEISVSSGCDLFMIHLNRNRMSSGTSDQPPDTFGSWKSRMVQMGESFAGATQLLRPRIAVLTQRFFHDGITVLTHSYSRVVMKCLLHASQKCHMNLSVIVTEARPATVSFDPSELSPGMRTAKELAAKGIPVTLIPDVGIGAIIPDVDMVLVGAAAVVESGGIVNRLGTFQLAIIAKEFRKPFYCAAESYKFTRQYPLTQKDLESLTPIGQLNYPPELPRDPLITYKGPTLDYTPPSYISLLFTDLGILTPSAVSDELIKLYQE